MSNGKGDTRRPMQIPPEEFDQRWAETFGKPIGMTALEVADRAVAKWARSHAEPCEMIAQQDPITRERLQVLAQQQQWPT